MKLYATVTSERNSRPAKKGGDKEINIKLTEKDLPKYDITYKGDTLLVLDKNYKILLEIRD